MMKPSAGLANEVMEGVLEFSADVHIQRREVSKDSPAFQSLTGAIAAYGGVLALLTALRQREAFDPIAGQNVFRMCCGGSLKRIERAVNPSGDAPERPSGGPANLNPRVG